MRACCAYAPRRSRCVHTAREYGLLWSADEKLYDDSSGYGDTLPLLSTSLPIRRGTSALPPTKWCEKNGRGLPSLATGSIGIGSGWPIWSYRVCAVPG